MLAAGFEYSQSKEEADGQNKRKYNRSGWGRKYKQSQFEIRRHCK